MKPPLPMILFSYSLGHYRFSLTLVFEYFTKTPQLLILYITGNRKGVGVWRSWPPVALSTPRLLLLAFSTHHADSQLSASEIHPAYYPLLCLGLGCLPQPCGSEYKHI